MIQEEPINLKRRKLTKEKYVLKEMLDLSEGK